MMRERERERDLLIAMAFVRMWPVPTSLVMTSLAVDAVVGSS